MNKIYNFIKTKALVWLPNSFLQMLKRRHYAHTLKVFNLDEEPDLYVIEKLIKKGDYVIDIGANIGVYTNKLSEWVGENGKVFAIEPVPGTFDILHSNLKGNICKNINFLNMAISDEEASVIMEIPEYSTGGDNIYRSRIINNNVETTPTATATTKVHVKANTLDNVIGDYANNIKFIKCDVEGHELACIKGAAKILDASNSAWLIEISDNPDQLGTTSNELFNILGAKGYKPWQYLNGKLKKRDKGQRTVNYFFLKDFQIDELKKSNPDLF